MPTFSGDVIVTDGGGLTLVSTQGNGIVRLSAGNGDLKIGGNGVDGDIMMFPKDAESIGSLAAATVHLDAQSADLRLGGHGRSGEVRLFPTTAAGIQDDSQATIRLNGEIGDIELINADAAEDFDVVGPVEPGDVVVLDDDGRLGLSEQPYDRRIAGVIAGAAGRRPGIVLGRIHGQSGRMPVALVGRVLCKAQVIDAPIVVGDLLTSSPSAGRAMRVTEHGRAFGAVLGKAMGRLDSGIGLVPVLVALQ